MTFHQALLHLPFWFIGLLSFILGACIGSFLDVIIYRIPIGPAKRAAGLAFNINTPRSHCPVCQHQLRWYENIPLLSWTIQRAKCKSCRTTIPIQYPGVELAVAVISTCAWALTSSFQIVILVVLACMTIIPVAWWVMSKKPWSPFMFAWFFSLNTISMFVGGYLWTIN